MADIKYRFIASGQNEVASAFQGIDRAAARSGAAVSAAYGRSATAASRSATQSSTARQKAEERWGQAAQKAADKAVSATERAEQKRWREVERTVAKIEREYAREAAAAERASRAKLRAEERVSEHRRRAVGRLGRDALLAGGGALVAGSTALVGAAARDSIRLGELANRFSINARLAGQSVSASTAQRTFENVALSAPGIKSQDVGEAALAFQSKTGQVLGPDQLKTLATAAQASGGQIQDIAGAAASLSEKFGIKSSKDLKETFAALIGQGAKGSFELKDAAAQFDRLTSAAGRLGIGTGPQAAKLLGGLTQISRSATGSPEQAATALEATFRQLTARTGDLRQAGVRVFDDKGQARNITEVLAETIGKVGGSDIEKKKVGLQKIFGEEGIRAISPLIKEFADATSAGKDGMQAIRDKINDAINVTTSWGDVQTAAAQKQQDSSAQLTQAWEQVKQVVGAEVVPELLKMAPAVVGLASKLGPLAGAFGILLEAVNMLADTLGIKGKQKTKTETLNEAKEKLRAFEEEVAGKHGSSGRFGATPEENAKLQQLRKNVEEADAALFQPAGQAIQAISEKDFLAQMRTLQSRRESEGDSDFAKNIAAQIARGEHVGGLTTLGLPDAQKKLIEAREQGAAIEKTGGTLDTEAVQKSIDGASAKFDSLTATLDRVMSQMADMASRMPPQVGI